MHESAFNSEDFASFRKSSYEVHHRRELIHPRVSEWKSRDGADVILELTRACAVNRPVT